MPNLPERVDRAAIERIIQRAAELQTGERDLDDGLTKDELLALGKDVGIPERHLRQALLEDRSRTELPASKGWLDSAMGGAVITAERVIEGDQASIEQRLLRWMDDHELLTVQRQQPGRITWEPVRGMQSAFRRSAAALSGKAPFMLSRAQVVSATVSPLETGFCHVALSADLRQTRSGYVGGILAITGTGAAAGLVIGLLSPFAWAALLPAPFVIGLGLGISRLFRPVAQRTLLGLERALDQLERGAVKPIHALPTDAGGLMGAVLSEVRKVLKP
ncbi:MAG: hypothetical protein ABI587_16545 [Gemmatimonadales bacterium]